MSSQMMLIVLIAVAFLIVLLALLIDEPTTTVDEPVVGEGDPVAVDPSDLVRDLDHDRDAVGAPPSSGQPVDDIIQTSDMNTEPLHPWHPREPDQGDTDDARRAAGLPPTPGL